MTRHGAGIVQKKWLKQFVGYQGESIELGVDIDAVTGGTLSSEALVEDIQRCYKLMAELVGD